MNVTVIGAGGAGAAIALALLDEGVAMLAIHDADAAVTMVPRRRGGAVKQAEEPAPAATLKVPPRRG